MTGSAFVLASFLFFLAGGCCLIPEYQPLMNLKNLEEEHSRTAEGLKKDEARYYKLVRDLKEGGLKKGAAKKAIFSEYGQPVLSRQNTLIYRHPTEFFSSDMVYLYFDSDEKLSSWELKPAP